MFFQSLSQKFSTFKISLTAIAANLTGDVVIISIVKVVNYTRVLVRRT